MSNLDKRLSEALRILSESTVNPQQNKSPQKSAPIKEERKLEAPIKEDIENDEQVVSKEEYTHLCRNRVYRQGVVKRCNRLSLKEYCDPCEGALQEQKLYLLGLSEAKKEPSNKPEDLDVEDSFEVHDDYDEDKEGPKDKGDPRLGLDSGPKGEQGSKKSPYLKNNK